MDVEEEQKQTKITTNQYENHKKTKEEVEFLISNNPICLTSQHHSIFLKYMKINDKFITAPELFETLVKQMVFDLNLLGITRTACEWLNLMSNWKNNVKRSFEVRNKTKKSYKFTVEEIELLNLINDKTLIEITPSQLNCMLDHLEIASGSPKLWTTITLEMEALGGIGKNEEYWKKCYEKWCVRVRSKKKLLDEWDTENSHSDRKPNILSNLESRLLEFLEKNTNIIGVNTVAQLEFVFSNYCRICLSTSMTLEMISIFNDSPEHSNLVDKINQCACISPVEKNDGFPQNICVSCIELVENAFKFKTLCEKTDSELRNMSKDSIKMETKEFLDTDTLFETASNYEDIDFQSFNEDVNQEEDDCEEEDDGEEEEEEEEDDDDEVEDLESKDENFTINENNKKLLNAEKRRKVNLKRTKRLMSEDVNVQCETCGIICKHTNSLKIHMRSHSDFKPHHCNDCGKEFKTRLSLKIHIRSHTGERPYVCEVCGKPFTQIGSLLYHRKIHMGIKNYECTVCDFRARSQHDLNIHTRKHTGQRNYECAVCARKFTTSSNLQKHLRRHTGKKDFKTCGKAFKTCSAVNNHRAIHSGLKEFKCPHCPYRACTKANLKIHDRTHSGIQPYACRFCDIKFSTASNMHKHIRNIHEKLKTHKCDQCGRCFFSRESARKHMVTHTGLKPYSCTQCVMAYGWYNGLQKHMKMQHPGIKMPTEKSFFNNIVPT